MDAQRVRETPGTLAPGGVPERSNGSVLKTDDCREAVRGFKSHPRRLHGRAGVSTVVRSLSPFLGEKEELMRRKIAAAICAAVLTALGAGAALAGEVKGPPGTPSTTSPAPGTSGPTQAPAHANSACAFSGLNDLVVGQGPTDFIVQSSKCWGQTPA